LGKAERLLDDFERRARDVGRGWALALAGRCRGLLLAARGSNEVAFETFEDSLRRHENLELPIERGRTLLELGRLHRRCKHRYLARDNLGQALAIFVSSGAVVWAEKARSEQARGDGSPKLVRLDGDRREHCPLSGRRPQQPSDSRNALT